jgi:hypothetical protein
MDTDVARIVGYRLKLSGHSVRELLDDLESAGVHLRYVPTTGDLCPCSYHYATESGLCVKCETERELELQMERDDDERRRLEEQTTRRINATKKARERMRRQHMANPRDKEAKAMLAAVDEFIALMEEAQDESEEESWHD